MPVIFNIIEQLDAVIDNDSQEEIVSIFDN